MLDTFLSSQQGLAQQMEALIAQGAAGQQIQAWQQENATALANQQQLALDMAAESELQPMPFVAQPNFQVNASQTLKDFLTTLATLANARAQVHNQLLDSLPEEVSQTQLSQMQQSEVQLFQQQHATDLQFQQQSAQTLANEAAQQLIPVPPPLVVPQGTSPQLAAFLTAKDQLARDEITFTNQYANATQQVRDAALQQWREQNGSRFQQVQALALQLPTTPTTTQN